MNPLDFNKKIKNLNTTIDTLAKNIIKEDELVQQHLEKKKQLTIKRQENIKKKKELAVAFVSTQLLEKFENKNIEMTAENILSQFGLESSTACPQQAEQVYPPAQQKTTVAQLPSTENSDIPEPTKSLDETEPADDLEAKLRSL